MDSLQVMILGVQKYEFKDDRTERLVKGVTVHYCQLTSQNDGEDKVGFFPTKASFADLEVFNHFKKQEFPLLAQATITFDLSNKRNPIKVTGFHDLQTLAVEV